jgi:hypothetical protein
MKNKIKEIFYKFASAYRETKNNQMEYILHQDNFNGVMTDLYQAIKDKVIGEKITYTGDSIKGIKVAVSEYNLSDGYSFLTDDEIKRHNQRIDRELINLDKLFGKEKHDK